MDFVALAAEIEERYRRYLQTTFYLRDPKLRASFDRALRDGRLSKGPYLEVTPAFRKGQTPRRLFEELTGGPLDQTLDDALDGNRPMYAHQEAATRRVAAGRNIVVATGTGSGKTECFLYPILLHLYREHLQGTLDTRTGVRSLVLYPMNALAYDQRDRLGRLHGRLSEAGSPFRFSFGQYTGATPNNKNDTFRHAEDVITHRFSGELVLRDEMRTTPPHLLLTNFSMLEYQLLRPDDSPLFDGPNACTWTFLVLDEAHQYRGIRGAEMSLLLRRLKQRLRKNGNEHSFRCIATSASLAGGQSDRGAVAAFAASLFDEPFDAEDVILAEVQRHLTGPSHQLPPEAYPKLCEAIETRVGADLELLEKNSSNGAGPFNSMTIPVRVGTLLAADSRTRELQEYVAAGPREVEDVARHVFPEMNATDAIRSLGALSSVLNQAEQPGSRGPFLSGRYHLFLRALEGAFVRYTPEGEIALTPGGPAEKGTPSFELALCRECGQHYLVGRQANGFFAEAVRDPSRDDFGVSFFRPMSSDEDEEDTGSEQRKARFELCVECGALWSAATQPRCKHATRILVEEQPTSDQHTDQMQQCSACGYRGQDPVREVIHGGDGPHAVIATGLFERLDDGSRKILAFADSRQEAAYFAWYLDDTYQNVLRRNTLYRAVIASSDREDDPLSLGDMADAYQRMRRKSGLVDEAATRADERRRAWLDVYREFLSEETRLSLAGVALVRWSMQWSSSLKPPGVLLGDPWNFSEADARTMTFLLLDQLRRDRAVELDTRGEIELDWSDLDLFGMQRYVRLGPPGGQKQVVSWNGPHGWRTQFLAKVLTSKGYARERALDFAESALRSIWDQLISFSDAQPSDNRLLVRVKDGRRLNPVWWRISPIAENENIYRCDRCNRIEATEFRNVCSRSGCGGQLVCIAGGELANNHYRNLYREPLAGNLVVEEHTAQLSTERGREIQRDFQEGRINVLSCSTTFELGVDLGDLNTVFLRNVPPEPFNYVQRVGRAGRRAGSPGFAVTYCRRGPHDLYHFGDPMRLLSGKTKPPSISVRNERVAERHLAAVVLSEFFCQARDRFESVEELVSDWSAPSLTKSVDAFVRNSASQLEKHLKAIFPPELVDPLGLTDGSWMDRLTGEQSRLVLAELEVVSDYQRAHALEMGAKDTGEYGQAGWAQRRKTTIAREDALSFLSRKAVIPKYGFPVDVVELDTQRIATRESRNVALARDLAIAIGEFAPTATLVAGKYEWQSYGLKKVPEKEWERKKYKVCHKHNLMVTWNEGEAAPSLSCDDPAPERSYVIPKFGFVTSSRPPKAPARRPTRLFTTRPYFLGSVGAGRGEISIDGRKGPIAIIRKAIPGRMAVLCEGRRARQFYICGKCGTGLIERPRSPDHKAPWNSDCKGTFGLLSLGHEFVTDVVQIEFRLAPGPGGANVDLSALGLGVATALLEGMAEVVDVPSTDLSVTIGRGGETGLPVIVLYDAVPGGAGLVARIEAENVFRRALQAAYSRVEGACGCGEDASCYGCLRSYRNQFAHTQLKRGLVKRYIDEALSQFN